MKARARVCRRLFPAAAVLGSLFFAAMPVVGSGGAVAQTASSIVVEGNRRIEADTIRSYFHAAGERLDPAAVDEGLKALYRSGLFDDVRIDRSGGRLIVTVTEAPVINRVQFEGNKRLKDGDLAGEIRSKPRAPLIRAAVQADAARIAEVYRRGGRVDARVEPKIIELPENRVDLVFEISEGARTSVREIAFTGNRAYSASRLKDVVKTRDSGILSFLRGSDLYDPDRIEADRELLRRFYLDHGYADVRIVAAAAQYDPARKGFIVGFTIDEGELYRFGTIDVRSSIPQVDPQSLRARAKPMPGAIYNAAAAEKAADAITIALSKRGYAFAKARLRGDRDGTAHLINLVYLVEEGPRVYVERINIRGNAKTRDFVIRREFDIAEGDAYNRALIDRAERRLKNLGYFKTVKIADEPGSTPDRVVVNVDVEEGLTGDFWISGGYSTAYGIIAEVTVGERNFLGRGEYVKASVTYGQYVHGFDVAFAEPYFLGSRMTLGLDVFDREALANSYQSYGSTTYGAGIKLASPLTEQLSMDWHYSIYSQSLTLAPALMDCSPTNPPPGCYANGEASLPIKQAALNGPALVSLAGNTLSWNTLDDNRNPKNGVRADLRQDVAGLGGNVNFFKTTADFRSYHEVADDLVGMARLQGGNVTPWGGRPLPLLNGFFGGPQMVRGFAPNGFGPRDLTPGTSMDNVGGGAYWATTAELQTPVPNLPSEAGLKVAVFADAGSVWGYRGPTAFTAFGQPLQVANSSAIRSSVGAGLIWASPFGPLRVDYAVATTKTGYDVLQPFRFSAGGF